jgi:hypothetical protein
MRGGRLLQRLAAVASSWKAPAGEQCAGAAAAAAAAPGRGAPRAAAAAAGPVSGAGARGPAAHGWVPPGPHAVGGPAHSWPPAALVGCGARRLSTAPCGGGLPTSIRDALVAAVHGRGSEAAAVLEAHGHGESFHATMAPELVLFPETTEEVSLVLTLCNSERPAGASFAGQGASRWAAADADRRGPRQPAPPRPPLQTRARLSCRLAPAQASRATCPRSLRVRCASTSPT